MAGVEFDFGKSASASQPPPPSTNPFHSPSTSPTAISKMDAYGGGSQGQVMDTDEIPHHRPREDSSCHSEEEEMEGEGVGRLQIVLGDTLRGEEERHGHGGGPKPHHHHHQDPLLSDVDEEEEDEDDEGDESRRRAAGRMDRKSLRPLLREPFGNLTVTKFPLNNNGQQTNYGGRVSSPSTRVSGGAYGDNYSSKQGGNGRRMQSLHEPQFQFMSNSSPQTSPNNAPLNNNNNSIPSLNNNKEGKLPFLPIISHGGGGKSPERQGPQRRNHQGHFVNPPTEYSTLGGGSYPQGDGGKDRNKSPPSNHSSPTIRDLKPDLAEGGLNMLSRSLGTALLNLASLGNFPTFQQPHHHQGLRSPNPPKGPDGQSPFLAPLNLSNGGASSYLAQCMAQQSLAAGATPLVNIPSGRSSPATFPHPNNLPQLILASGSIVQGIQGAQLLIPSPQGLMTQTVLTIPITQPLSPSSPPPPPPPPMGPSRKSQQRPTRSPSPTGGGAIDFGAPSNQAQGPMGHNPLISDKLMSLERNLRDGLSSGAGNRSNSSSGQHNGFRMTSGGGGRRENSSSPLISAALNNNHQQHHHQHNHHHQQQQQLIGATTISSHFHNQSGSICPTSSQLSPSSSHMSHEEEDNSDFLDRCSDNDDDDTMMDGINLDEIKEFAKAFKLRRLSLGLTQTQVGQALSVTEGPAYSQSAICSALAWQLAQSQSNRTLPIQQQQSMFEKLDITPKSAQKIKPVLEKWMKEAEDRYRTGNQNLNEFVGMEPSKKRKRRTSFTPQALEILNTHFERNTHPSGAEITTLAHQLGYEREVIRIWFCNKRQALKNTVRMMSKAGSPA